MSLNFVPNGSVDEKSPLVQIMAWTCLPNELFTKVKNLDHNGRHFADKYILFDEKYRFMIMITRSKLAVGATSTVKSLI